MKTLNDHLILYDAECPMCSVYTKAFTKSNMLDKSGRACYQEMSAKVCAMVDKQRAANEIALVNTCTGEVTYGVESLFKIIGNSFPLFKYLFAFGPFIWVMTKVYAFISYNRRVIVPAAQENGVQPSFRLSYRLAYLLLTWFAVGAILTAYAAYLAPMVPAGGPLREYYICGGQVIFQGIVISSYAQANRWDYLGNMMTISSAGALLLLPVMLVAKLAALGPVTCTICFLGVAGLMFLEHIRRTKLMQLGWLLTGTWVIYRMALLLIILN